MAAVSADSTGMNITTTPGVVETSSIPFFCVNCFLTVLDRFDMSIEQFFTLIFVFHCV